MLSKHPLEVPSGRKLSGGEVAEALRLAVIAELDAINLYLQLARAIDDDRVRRVFEDVAEEEKTHVGEFLSLLEHLDPSQASELKRGAAEVKELTGLAPPTVENTDPGENSSGASSGDPLQRLVESAFKGVYGEARVMRRFIAVVDLGVGAESTIIEAVGDGVKRTVIPLSELSLTFKVSQRDLDYSGRVGSSMLAPELYEAAMRLAAMEDALIVTSMLSAERVERGSLSDWDAVGAPVLDVAGAVSRLYSAGVPRPFLLVLSPSNYAKLARVSERAGLLELERVSRLVDNIAVTPSVGDDKVIVASTKPYIVDVVVGGDVRVDYLGPSNGYHGFRAWELIAVRVKQPGGIIVLEGR